MILDESLITPGNVHTGDGIYTSQIKKHHSGLFYRTDVVDLLSIQESFSNYKNVRVYNRIVLDMGANVGGFSWMAANAGASNVYAFEPEPNTFAMLIKNMERFPANSYMLYNRAMTSLYDNYVGLYVGFGRGAPSTASTESRRGRRCIPVKNENFKEFVDTIQPNTIKMDIEGGEYNIVLDIPDSCDELALEWHGSTPERKAKFNKIYPLFMEMGWQVIKEKKRESFKKYALSKGREPRWSIDAHYKR
jgi:FkbM family methyltransferase